MVCLRPLFGWHNGKQNANGGDPGALSLRGGPYTGLYRPGERERKRENACMCSIKSRIQWDRETRQQHSKQKGLNTAPWGTPLCRVELLHTWLIFSCFWINWINHVRDLNFGEQKWQWPVRAKHKQTNNATAKPKTRREPPKHDSINPKQNV